MLRVFSGQLRDYHKKSKALLKNYNEPSQDEGMLDVAKCFFIEKKYRSCMDVCIKYLTQFPEAGDKEQVVKLYEHSKKFAEKNSEKIHPVPSPSISSVNNALGHFMLPAFERFQKKYENEQVIICEHEPGDSFYLIQSGEVQLVKCVSGTSKNLDILKPGEFFGEMAILEKSPRSATCIARGPVQCLKFDKENFEVLVTGNPQIAIILLKLFCKRIYDQKRRYRILTIREPIVRIYDVFCMYDEMGLSTRNVEKTRSFNIKAQDIVQWSGLSAEKVQDELNKLVSKKRLQIFDNYMIVANIEEMKYNVEMKMQSHF